MSRESLAIVCCYFNPAHFQRRRTLYDVFSAGIRRTGVHLLTVELAFGADPFELPATENVLQIRTGDVMWQKERLLNVGIASLPKKFNKIGWFDCDILFASDSWVDELDAALDQFQLVQCFRDVAYLPEGALEPQLSGERRPGWVFALRETDGWVYGECGFAWGARRELLERCPLYDVRILGGADLLMALSCIEQPDLLTQTEVLMRFESFRSFNPPSIQHYWEWSHRFKGALNGSVSYLPHTICPLFHGNVRDRFYTERALLLRNFNPYTDITIGSDQCWHWATPKLAMHSGVREYFALRAEDGR